MISKTLKDAWIEAAKFQYTAMVIKQAPEKAQGISAYPVDVFAPSSITFTRLINQVLRDTGITDETLFAEENRAFIKGQFFAMARDKDPEKVVKARSAAALLVMYDAHCQENAFTSY